MPASFKALIVVLANVAVSNGTATVQSTLPPGTKPGFYKVVGVYHDMSGFFPNATATSSTNLLFGTNRRHW